MLLVIVAIVGVWWALLVPPWQAPDTQWHYAYMESLIEGGRLPGDPKRPQFSADQWNAMGTAGSLQTQMYPWDSATNWSAADWQAFRRKVDSDPPSRSDGGGSNPAQPNPPLYYLYAAVAYLIDSGGTALGRLYSIQLWGVLLLLATTVGGWLLAGETFGRRRTAQLACASVVGLLPMTAFLSTSVNPDAMLITVWTFALWLGARVINRRAAAVDSVALCAVTAAAILINATGYALVPPVVLALAIGWWQRPRLERRHHLMVIGSAGLTLVLPVLGWIAFTRVTGRPTVNEINVPTSSVLAASQGTAGQGAAGQGAAGQPVTRIHLLNLGDFLSYLWQFYLPRLPFMPVIRDTPELSGSGLPIYRVWLEQGAAGVFGGAFGVYLPTLIYAVVGGFVAGALATAVALLTRIRDAIRLRLLAFYAVMVVVLLAFLHVNDWRLVVSGGWFLQGRYLLPVSGLLGLCVGLIVTRVPLRFKAAACGLTLTALLGLEAVSLVTVLQGYYL
jgi:4-amino-4-deoxy-L-arabinose transferase-like glycosyltransferase